MHDVSDMLCDIWFSCNRFRDSRNLLEATLFKKGLTPTPTPENVEKSWLRVTQTPGIYTTLEDVNKTH